MSTCNCQILTVSQPQVDVGSWDVKSGSDLIGIIYVATESGAKVERLGAIESVPLSSGPYTITQRTTNTFSPGAGNVDTQFIAFCCDELSPASGQIHWLKSTYTTGTASCP